MARVQTLSGIVEGVERERHSAFYGMPYAAAPSGERRWKAPKPPAPWAGVRDASTPGLAALQTPHPLPGFAASGPHGEDCLNLNVFTPAADGEKRPVLFWIHGGGFTHGSGYEALYDGGALAVRGDVVVVSINYRLGAFGFLDLTSVVPETTANAGLLDCIAALEWVRDNIAAFGGDPGRVTIFGESAGSGAVHALCAMPAARPLFQRAIQQSGVTRGLSKEQSAKTAAKVLEALGLTRANADEIFKLPTGAILDAQANATPRSGGLAYAPVVDGVTMPKPPMKAAADGDYANIGLMIGSNRDETKLFAMTAKRDEMDETRLLKAIGGLLPKATEQDVRALVNTYRASRERLSLPTSNLDMFDAINSDLMFRIASTRLAVAQGKHRPTYLYLFTYPSPARRGALGACHALEIPFVFGNCEQPLQKPFAGTGPAVAPLSEAMMDAWLAFAKTGKPRTDWPGYDAGTRATLIWDADIRVENDPLGDERAALDALVGDVGI